MSAVSLASIQDVEARLRSAGYLPSPEIATSVFLADRLEKPVLVEGPAGVGKTELARAFAQATGLRLIRLQCYEGLDEAKALYEWEYAKQLLYTQLLKDKIAETIAGAGTLREAADRVAGSADLFFSERSDALKRRCLHLYIDFPSAQRELEIVRERVPGVSDQLARKVVAAVQAIRKLDLKKLPSIAETLDWIRALLLLNAAALDAQLVSDTLSTLLKYEADIAKAREHVGYIASADLPATIR